MRPFQTTAWQYNMPHQDVLLLLPFFLFKPAQLKIDYLAPKISLAFPLHLVRWLFFFLSFSEA